MNLMTPMHAGEAGCSWAAAYTTIVLEGTDGTGKTTLANLLGSRHGFGVVHSPRTPEGVDLADRYRQLLNRPGRLVLDRSFVSELVYGPLLRGRSRIDWDTATQLICAVTDRRGVFVHLTAPASTIAARLRARDETSSLSTELIGRLNRAYEHIFAKIATLAPVITVDTGNCASSPSSAHPPDTE